MVNNFDKPTDREVELQKEFQKLTIYIKKDLYGSLLKKLGELLPFGVYEHSYFAPCGYDTTIEAQAGKLLSWLLIDSDELWEVLQEVLDNY